MKPLPEKLDIVESPRDRLDFLRQEEQRIAEEIRAHKAEVRNRNIAAECGQTISMAEILHWKQRHKALADALQAVFCETRILNEQICAERAGSRKAPSPNTNAYRDASSASAGRKSVSAKSRTDISSSPFYA